MARETRTLGNQTFQDGNLKAAVDGDLVPPTFTAVPLSEADTEWEDYVETFGSVGLINAVLQAYGSGGGGGSYTNLTPMPVTVGGLAAGTTFSSQTMAQMFDGLLYPYQAPAFTAFAISGQATIIEVGAEIAINRTFTWSTSNSANVAASSIDLVDVTGGLVNIVTGLVNDGSEATSYPASPIYKTSDTIHTFRIDGENTHSGTFSSTFSVSWQWRKFYGELSSAGPLVESDIEGLRSKDLSAAFAGTYVFETTGYKYICYPASLGTASSFKDESTNLDVPFQASYTVNVTNGTAHPQTTSYRVHRTTNIIGSAINIVVS